MSGQGETNKGDDPKESGTHTEHTKPREPSPLRASRSSSSIPQVSRSRKGSQEFSPTRNTALSGTLSTIPSAAAVQRALSAHRPVLQPGGIDGVSESIRTDKSSKSTGNNSPAWPISPRLKSPPPPPTGSRNLPPPKRIDNDHTPSNTSIKRLATHPGLETNTSTPPPESAKEQSTLQPTLRPPGRGVSAPSGTLETVAESSVPSTPSLGPVIKSLSDSAANIAALNTSEPSSETSTMQNGHNSEAKAQSAAVKPTEESKARTLSSSRGASSLAKRSLTSLTTVKPKAPDPPRTMTVETEPVVTVSQILGPDRNLTGRDGSGSVRTKPSTETMRPKKEKKRSARKAPSLHSGTVTSKADIFEAKVASAVDEADTSDSDETFVYESNPPDARSHRHHSRTPSATSLASTEPHGRNRHGLRAGSHAVGAKKSQKFSNSGYQQDEEEDASGRGSLRNPSHRHHHIGRHGKSGHNSILDPNSPFNQVNKHNSPRSSATNIARLSRPSSPRQQNGRVTSSPKKGSAFDMYDNVADDERTPLMGNVSGSVRINRNRHSRRPHGSGLRNTEYYEEGERSIFSRMGGCLVVGFVVFVLCVGIATFIIGLNQPLIDVKVRHLQNILASEQELMLDLHVDAINTNIFGISVNDLDVNLFAESSYVGSSTDYEKSQLRWANRRGSQDDNALSFPWPFPTDGVDESTDPIDDPEPGMQKMLLGAILEFDSPLMFDASPLRRRRSSSVGEIRLAKPGNQTEAGGTERWERVLQHDFNLILRGVIRYQLPLSSKVRSVKIAGKATVQPNGDDGSNSTTTTGQ